MSRATPVLLPLLLLAACTVERTPPEILDRQDPVAAERREALDELRDRVSAFRVAVRRGDLDGAVAALDPLVTARVVGVEAGELREGPAALEEAVAAARGEGRLLARTPDLQVNMAPDGRTAWFATHLELLEPDRLATEADRIRVTGLLLRTEGDWHLVQIHLSRPETPPSPDEEPAEGG